MLIFLESGIGYIKLISTPRRGNVTLKPGCVNGLQSNRWMIMHEMNGAEGIARRIRFCLKRVEPASLPAKLAVGKDNIWNKGRSYLASCDLVSW